MSTEKGTIQAITPVVVSRMRKSNHDVQPKLLDLWCERSLAGLAIGLGAREIEGWSDAEEQLLRESIPASVSTIEKTREQILAGQDPLGDLFCTVRGSNERRQVGAVYTPKPIVQAMIDWGVSHGDPTQVVDPGCGSARFLLEAGQRFPKIDLIGIEIDPLASLIARASLSAAGLGRRSTVYLRDYRSIELEPTSGKRLFIGNPPYVRHHGIETRWKEWLSHQSEVLGMRASQLAGLHVHFFLATAVHGRVGDFGAFITAAEWLDVNYGSLVRELFLNELGGQGIVVIDPTASPFPDAAVTGAVTYFEIGSRPRKVMMTRVKTLADLRKPDATLAIGRRRLETEARWSHFTRTAQKPPSDHVELGELCRVHRGAVTGANHVWIAGTHSTHLPERFLAPAVTRAREIFDASSMLDDVSLLKRVILLPDDLSMVDLEERKKIKQFLRIAKNLGADQGYVARNRKAWWSVCAREPAPILATYMARRAPGFALNQASAYHLNIAHGLYPREAMSDSLLLGLVRFLSRNIDTNSGRTYAGGLTKFEPREMERLLVPEPHVLREMIG